MSLEAKEKVARQRLSVLELAEALGNAAEACRRRGIWKSQFYEYKKRFKLYGIEGLKDLPPIHKTHPQTTPPEVEEKIIATSLTHPTWGCCRLSSYLKLADIFVSSPTIQKILIRHGMASRYERLLKLEERVLETKIDLTVEQVKAIEKANPCFRERHVESEAPGQLLSQDTFYVGHLKGIGKVYMQSVVDTYGSYAFAYLHTGKLPEHAVAVLHNDVFPRYEEWRIEIKALLTDNGREYCGRNSHPYELYLELNDMEHRKTAVRRPQTNGFVERFHRTVLDEFFRIALRSKSYQSIQALQDDLNIWLQFYNIDRPHLGYRNRGKRPIETINNFIKSVRHDD